MRHLKEQYATFQPLQAVCTAPPQCVGLTENCILRRKIKTGRNCRLCFMTLLAVGHKKTVIFTLQPMLQAAGGSAGSRFVLVEHTQHKCDKFLWNRTTCQGLGFGVCSIRGQRRRPPLILPQYHRREMPDKFKYEFNEKTTTPGYFFTASTLAQGLYFLLDPSGRVL